MRANEVSASSSAHVGRTLSGWAGEIDEEKSPSIPGRIDKEHGQSSWHPVGTPVSPVSSTCSPRVAQAPDFRHESTGRRGAYRFESKRSFAEFDSNLTPNAEMRPYAHALWTNRSKIDGRRRLTRGQNAEEQYLFDHELKTADSSRHHK